MLLEVLSVLTCPKIIYKHQLYNPYYIHAVLKRILYILTTQVENNKPIYMFRRDCGSIYVTITKPPCMM